MWQYIRAIILGGLVIVLAGCIASSINLHAGAPRLEDVNCTVDDCDGNVCLYSTVFYYNKGSPCGLKNFMCYLSTYSPLCSEVNGTSGKVCVSFNDWNLYLRECAQIPHQLNGWAVSALAISVCSFILLLSVLICYFLEVDRSRDPLVIPILTKGSEYSKL